jgi:hypothetical protein
VINYDRPSKQWKPITGFDCAGVHGYVSDAATRVRLLGWKEPASRTELEVYLDLQFVEEGDYKAFVTPLYLKVDFSNSLLSR